MARVRSTAPGEGTDRALTDDHIDNLIDDVAKEMTSAPAGDNFARRVSMRIANARGRREWWMSTSTVATAAAAACVVAIAVFIESEKRVVVVPPQVPNVGRPFQGREGGAESPAPRVAVVARRDTAALPRIVPISDAPAPAVPPIEIRTLDVQRLVDVQQIEISPIAIDRIEIAPMP